MEQHLAEGAAVFVVLVLGKVADHYKGKKRDKSNHESISRGFDGLSRKIDMRTSELQAAMDVRFLETNACVAEVRAHVIGPDGEGGLRADVKEVKARVIGLEERERDRLADERLHRLPDRRT